MIPDLKLRTEQVLTARAARGLVGRRTIAAKMAQIPRILMPLVSWALRSALLRAELWEHRGLIERLSAARPRISYSVFSSVLFAGGALIFAVLALRSRFP